MLVRWLKTRQLVEVVPPGVPGREDDVWSVVLSRTDGVTELHKLLIEDEPKHARSYVWSVALKGYLNTLEAGGEIVAHADALPLRAAELPPLRGAVAVERLQGGASWLLQALEQRDAQIQGASVAARRRQIRDCRCRGDRPDRKPFWRRARPPRPPPRHAHACPRAGRRRKRW